VVDAATQQDGLQASAGGAGRQLRGWGRWAKVVLLSSALAGGGGRAEANRSQAR
jgi:hypothetical protein